MVDCGDEFLKKYATKTYTTGPSGKKRAVYTYKGKKYSSKKDCLEAILDSVSLIREFIDFLMDNGYDFYWPDFVETTIKDYGDEILKKYATVKSPSKRPAARRKAPARRTTTRKPAAKRRTVKGARR